MFDINLDYPTFEEEINIVKQTTGDYSPKVEVVLSHEEILFYQELVRRIPVADNVYNYCVKLASLTRPKSKQAHSFADQFISWGAGPRASQYLVLGAKCRAALKGKYSPDIEDVREIAYSVLRHRIVKNYKAEAEGISVDAIVEELMKI